MIGSGPTTPIAPTTLAALAAASAAVGAASGRTDKVRLLADLLATADPAETGIIAAYLAGDPPQGKVGVGWATLAAARSEAAPDGGHADQGPLTVTDLDTLLTRLATTSGPGSVASRDDLVGSFLARASTAEANFVQRLLLGELRQGANEGLVLEAVAAATGVTAGALRRALMLAGALTPVVNLARRGGAAALAEVRLEVGRPLRPMLAATAADVGSALAELGTCSVEWKLDGARVQVHRRGDDVRIVTRNLNDITSRHPALVAHICALPAHTMVLDGEVVGLPDEGDGPAPFQDTIAGFARDAGDAALVPWFFDCLHLDGTDLVDAPLRERRAALASAVGDRCVPGIITDDPGTGGAFLAEALAAGHEGVMVKALDSPYQAGRRGKTWRKVKPVLTYDLVVLAAEWGHGRRQGWLSNLHLGARHPERDEFVMVGKTFKGLTDRLLAWQTEALLAREVERRGITVWVRPELVVEIAIDGVQRSTRYPGGVALRFARVKRYREDKTPAEADVLTSLQALLAP